MKEIDREDIETFMNVTGVSEDVAIEKLAENPGDLNDALIAHFSEGDKKLVQVVSHSDSQIDVIYIEEETPIDLRDLDNEEPIDEMPVESQCPPSSPSPCDLITIDVPEYWSNDIEQEKMGVAIEASKQDAAMLNQQYKEYFDAGDPSRWAEQSLLENVDLASALSLSLQTAEQEQSLKDWEGKYGASEIGQKSAASIEKEISPSNRRQSEGSNDTPNSIKEVKARTHSPLHPSAEYSVTCAAEHGTDSCKNLEPSLPTIVDARFYDDDIEEMIQAAIELFKQDAAMSNQEHKLACALPLSLQTAEQEKSPNKLHEECGKNPVASEEMMTILALPSNAWQCQFRSSSVEDETEEMEEAPLIRHRKRHVYTCTDKTAEGVKEYKDDGCSALLQSIKTQKGVIENAQAEVVEERSKGYDFHCKLSLDQNVRD